MSSYNHWNEDDYPSSGDEDRNDRTRRQRERRTATNVEQVRNAVSHSSSSSGPSDEAQQNRAYVAALNAIREDPLVRAQLQRIEEVWTVKRDKVLADVLYTEVTLAIVQAARAIATVGQRYGNEEEDLHLEALRSARSRTVGNFMWSEPNTPDERDRANPLEQAGMKALTRRAESVVEEEEEEERSRYY